MPWQTFQEFVFDTLPARPRPWLIGYSGGLDSTVLLDLCWRFRHEIDPTQKIIAVHLNHGLREQDDAREERACETFCNTRDIPLISERIDVNALARAEGTGIEETARNARRRLFTRLAAEHKPAFIFLAHHADDQVETILMNFLRGADLRGLSGMEALTSIRTEDGLGVLVRPLLETPRTHLTAYARDRDLTWSNDPSNRDLRFTRNRIRHEALPLLESIRPGLRRRLLLLADNFNTTDLMLNGFMLTAYNEIVRPEKNGYAISELDEDSGYPTVWLRVVDHVVRRLRDGDGLNAAGFIRVRELWEEGRVGTQVHLASGIRVRLESDGIFVFRQADKLPSITTTPTETTILLPEDAPFTITHGDLRIEAKWHNLSDNPAAPDIPLADQNNPQVEWLDADALTFPLLLRERQPGDTMHPLGAPGAKKIKTLLIDLKVPQRHKTDARVLCDSDGIVWLWPHRLAERVRLRPTTRTALRLSVTRVEEFSPALRNSEQAEQLTDSGKTQTTVTDTGN